MSGSIGGDRIPHNAVQKTVEKYIKNILSGFEGFKSAKITGSYNTGQKKDHGDLDLCVYVEARNRDLRQVKKELKDYLESSKYTYPFRSGRNKGKKAQMYGTVVTCQVPIEGFEGLLVQVDNMVVLSEKEQEYQQNFLDADAAKQGLLMGLVRVIMTEENPETVLKRVGIKKVPELGKNQELEFVLSSSGLSLRRVTLENFKEVDREELWRSTDWQDVVKLLKNYDLSQDFDHLLADVKDKIKDARSRRRIIGIMKSMINVGVGEKGTPKGDAKERAIQAASNSLETLDEVAEENKKGVIGLYGGGFKPPHKGHYSVVQKLLNRVDRIIIFIGSGNREGIPINQDQSKEIWKIYIDASGWSDRVEIREVQSPVGEIYKIIQNPDLQEYQFRIAKSGEGSEEDKKWKWFIKNQDKFPNVKLITLPVILDKDSEKLSASDLRASETKIKKGNWIPQNVLSTEDISKVIDIALEQVKVEILKEELKAGKLDAKTFENIVKQGLQDAESSADNIGEGFYGPPSTPRAAISSEDREKLGHIYEELREKYESQGINVIFNGNNILLKVLYPGDIAGIGNDTPGNIRESEEDATREEEFDYLPYIVSYLKFLKEERGISIEPLPEIILNKTSQKGQGILAKTGEYNPEDKVITVYTKDRAPKDVLRSVAHEYQHAYQDVTGKLKGFSGQKTTENEPLSVLEEEAYRDGNMNFRAWLESIGAYEG